MIRRAVTWGGVALLVLLAFAIDGVLAFAAVALAGVLGVGVLWRRGGRPRHGQWPVVRDRYGREVHAYALGSMDKVTRRITHVKFGYSAQLPGRRERQVEHDERQVPRTHTVVALARGSGGQPRERAFHRRLDRHRYPASEWFGIHPEVVAAVGELERPTAEGLRFLKAHR